MNEATCGACRWSLEVPPEGPVIQSKPKMKCRRFPPTRSGSVQITPRGPVVISSTDYPEVGRDYPACGEFEAALSIGGSPS